MKGGQNCKFGHKVDIGTGASNLILTCSIPRGNPNDEKLFQNTIYTVKREYGKAPESVVTDGGYASRKIKNMRSTQVLQMFYSIK